MIRVLLKVASPALRAGLRALLSSDKALNVLNDTPDEEMEADVVITSASRASASDNELAHSQSAAVLLLGDGPLDVRALRRSFRVWGVLPAEAAGDELIVAVHALSQGLIVGTSTLLFDSESESEPPSHGPLTD
ncbi:MAG: hypothetical protein WCC12_22380, partial [Anaerolineales bacterium]